jgi:hypothetical protein
MASNTDVVQTWADFAAHVESKRAKSDRLLYRGQSNDSWRLEPSLVRVARKAGLTASETIDFEAKAFLYFTSNYHRHAPELALLHKGFEKFVVWCAMQHFGTPTRVLDWTYSPFVAAYFAVEDLSEHNGCIFALDKRSISETAVNSFGDIANPSFGIPDSFVLECFNPDAPEIPMFYQPLYASDRLHAQQGGLFVCSQVYADYENLIGLHQTNGCSRWIVPADQKPVFLRNLREMNITAASLFPGLDGLGRSIREAVISFKTLGRI